MSPIIGARGGLSASAYGFTSASAAGALASYESIQSYTLTSNSTTISFSSIPATYKHLQIRISSYQTVEANCRFRVGSGNTLDTGTNYYNQEIVSYQSSIGGSAVSADNWPIMNVGSPSYPVVGIIDIWDYSNTNKSKTMRALMGHSTNGAGATRVYYRTVVWNSTSALNIITFAPESNSYATGTKMALYGIKG
jgi:hypothetical protein